MSRSRTRARNHRARLNTILDRIEFAKSATERMNALDSLRRFLAGVEAADGRVWPLLNQIEGRAPPDKYGDEERLVIRAMIADVVAPWLSGSARSSLNRRYDYAKEVRQPYRQPNAVGWDDAR